MLEERHMENTSLQTSRINDEQAGCLALYDEEDRRIMRLAEAAKARGTGWMNWFASPAPAAIAASA